MVKIAIILLRGLMGITHDIKDTLRSLRLGKKHACVIIEDSPSLRGMLKKIQDFVTYGEVSDETITTLNQKRTPTEKGVYFLAPPRGGFERKGIKKPFGIGGALGDRKENINTLLSKMM